MTQQFFISNGLLWLMVVMSRQHDLKQVINFGPFTLVFWQWFPFSGFFLAFFVFPPHLSYSLSLSLPLSVSLPLSRQEGLRGCRVVWLQSGWSAGRMPVAALMTLFSSGVQGVGVSGWTLPDGSWGQGTMPTTVCGKENNWAKTASTNRKHTLVHIYGNRTQRRK